MQRETAIAGGMVVLLIAMLATPFVVPGTLQEPDDGNVRPSYLQLQEEDSTIAVQSVPGRTATLQLDTRLVHHGGESRNVTVEVRAIDDDSGLLVDQVREHVGNVSAGDRSLSVLTNVTVEREGSYRIETLVYQDGERVARGVRQISNVQALRPAYADSPVGFERFDNSPADIPAITVDPTSVENNRTELSITTALTNGGDTAAGDVTVRLRARQVESNLIADGTELPVGSIQPGRTVWRDATMTVPDGYNYYIDAILLKDGVVIDTAIGVANLDPTRTVQVNETRQEVEFDTGDFAGEGTPQQTEADMGEERTTVSSQGPGFGPLLAVVALLAIALLAARRDQ